MVAGWNAQHLCLCSRDNGSQSWEEKLLWKPLHWSQQCSSLFNSAWTLVSSSPLFGLTHNPHPPQPHVVNRQLCFTPHMSSCEYDTTSFIGVGRRLAKLFYPIPQPHFGSERNGPFFMPHTHTHPHTSRRSHTHTRTRSHKMVPAVLSLCLPRLWSCIFAPY